MPDSNNIYNNSINKSVTAMIDNIVTVVLRIHFYYITSDDLKEDLRQEGYLKAYELFIYWFGGIWDRCGEDCI